MSRARWVILTPSQTEPEWRQRVTDAAATAGLKPVQWSAELGPDILKDPKAVVLAQEMGHLRHFGETPDVVVLTDPESSVQRLYQTVLAQFPQALWTASQIHAEACEAPERVPVIGGAALSCGAPVTLWSGLTVAAPALPPRPKGERAAAEVMSLYHHGRPAMGARVRIAPKLFLYDTRNPVVGPRFEVDLTGRPRIVVYGPYVTLPPGRWRAEAKVWIDDDAANVILGFDWGRHQQFDQHVEKPGKPGLHAVSMVNDWDVAASAEFRLVLMQGAIAGKARLVEFDLERLG